VPAVDTSLVTLVLESKLAEMTNDVLHLGVRAVALLTSKVVEPSVLLEDEVDNGDDDCNTDGVTPDDDNGDDISIAVGGEEAVVGWWGRLLESVSTWSSEPPKDTEEGGHDIDDEDGANELPRWPCIGSTGDKDKPVLSEGDLQEEHTLGVTITLNHTASWEEEGATKNPGANSEQTTEDNRNNPNLGQLPLDRTGLEMCVIVSDSNGSQIREQSQEDNEIDTLSLVDNEHGRNQVHF